ncbi:MAG TPA: hypothetical protein VFW81_03770, partial [Thermoanaerobaculia bacterium]|nr:hypothetical protein [Thermoanaerobaculia bacterium]
MSHLRVRAFALFFLLLFLFLSVPAASGETCGEWQWANPAPLGNQLTAAAFGNGVYVAVGRAGTILTSPDGAAWTAQIANPKVDLADVLWTGSQFVAVGQGGAVLSSTDGRLWSFRRAGVTATLRKIASNGDLFVAVGDDGALVTSADARDWTERASGATLTLRDVAWGGG